ncbi:helix-turn-helix transcriptional regulator [Tissierella simiarum]|uniref:helix-turn-helix transcriptional regulator n=1 Tax=Tissierella simiarum TaxID=2841534 RepID=UPI0031B9ECD7
MYRRVGLLRKTKKISMKELAKGIVSYSHLSNFECGRYNLSEDIMVSLSNKLQVPQEYLINYDEFDYEFNQKLIKFEKDIREKLLSEAKYTMDIIIKDYPFINSILQEIQFLILKCYFYINIEKNESAMKIFNDFINFMLIDENDIYRFSQNIVEIYFYLKGKLNYYNKDYIDSYYNYTIQLLYITNNISKANTFYEIAITLCCIGELNNSVYYAEKALNIYLKELKWEDLSLTYNLIGFIYYKNNEIILAQGYYNKSLKIAKKFGLKNIQAEIYYNLALIHKLHKNYDEALKSLYKSLEISNKSNTILKKIYFCIIQVYIESNVIDKAEIKLKQVYKLQIDERDDYILKLLEAEIFLLKYDYIYHEKYIEESLKFFYRNNDWEIVKKICLKLSEYYANSRKYKKACNYYKILCNLENIKNNDILKKQAEIKQSLNLYK